MTEKKKNTKNINPKSNPRKPDNSGSKKPFNFYWIYGVIGAILIGINLFNFSGLKKTHYS